MSHHLFAKHYLKTLLTTVGTVTCDRTIPGRTLDISLWFDPDTAGQAKRKCSGDQDATNNPATVQSDQEPSSMTGTSGNLVAKQHLENLLEPFGTVTTHRKVTSETCEVDVWFVPNPEASTDHLGILGQMTKQPCMIEPFHNAVGPDEVRSCLGKLFNLMADLEQQADPQPIAEEPWLWILSPTLSEDMLSDFGAEPERGWLNGFYFLPPAFQTVLVALHQLPVTESTLWLRLMGQGGFQRRAIAELLALPKDHPLQQRTIEHLAVLQTNLQARENINEEESILATNLIPVYEHWRQETLQEERQEEERSHPSP
ncbi:MAG: hypothetical protein WA902_16060 [Thermosynechococcaceae cyanobacterium]